MTNLPLITFRLLKLLPMWSSSGHQFASKPFQIKGTFELCLKSASNFILIAAHTIIILKLLLYILLVYILWCLLAFKICVGFPDLSHLFVQKRYNIVIKCDSSVGVAKVPYWTDNVAVFLCCSTVILDHIWNRLLHEGSTLSNIKLLLSLGALLSHFSYFGSFYWLSALLWIQDICMFIG